MQPTTPTTTTTTAARYERAVRTAHAVVLLLTVLLGIFTPARSRLHLPPDLAPHHAEEA